MKMACELYCVEVHNVMLVQGTATKASTAAASQGFGHVGFA